MLLEGPSFALLDGFIVDEVRTLLNEDLEDVLDLLVLVTDVVSVTGGDRLVIDEFRLTSSLFLVVLTVHDGGVLVHNRVSLGG